MISVSEALEAMRTEMPLGGEERLPVADAAGRVLRHPVRAERAFPPFDRVMMDGIAVARTAWDQGERTFRWAGIAAAGAPQQVLADSGDAIEVMTGAVLPKGAGVVVPVEQLSREADHVTVDPSFSLPSGAFIHRTGLDASAGAVLLRAGRRLDGRSLPVAIACGATELSVSRQPCVAVVSTGDELVEIGQPMAPHQIRRSNAHALKTTLHAHGFFDVSLHHFGDEAESLAVGLERVLAAHDCVILSGGVSAGQRDFVPETLRRLGARIVFHKVAQRPGKPLLFAVRDETAVFGLPGNPVSTLVGLHRYVLPALQQWEGGAPRETLRVTLSEPVNFSPPLTYFLPVAWSGPGAVAPRSVANSGDFAALLDTHGFVELAAEQELFDQGFVAPFFSW